MAPSNKASKLTKRAGPLEGALRSLAQCSLGRWQPRGAQTLVLELIAPSRLRQIDGVDFVTLWTGDVRIPKAMATVDGPEAEYASFIRSVRLDDILAEVEGQVTDRP